MNSKRWLISWIGKTDHDCAEGRNGGDLGPIASAIKALPSFDRIHLLTNYEHERSKKYCDWLESTTKCVETDLYSIDLSSPIDYADIYEKVCAELKQARLPSNDVELADAVADHANGLPESLCQREIYELVAQMIMTALRLKQEYRIEGTADPISALDQAYPDWRGDFPLALDDDAAQRLLAGLVREANQTSLANELAAFSVIRVLAPIADGMYALQSSIAHPSVLSAESLVAQFELASAEDLPRYFNIDVAVNERVPLTVGRQILGTQNASVSLAAQRSKWVASDALNEHLLYLRDTTGDLHDGPVAIPGGESICLDEPLVFADRDHMLRFVGSGNLRLPEVEVFLAISDDALIQDPGQGDSPQLMGRVDFNLCSLRVFRITAGAVVINDLLHFVERERFDVGPFNPQLFDVLEGHAKIKAVGGFAEDLPQRIQDFVDTRVRQQVGLVPCRSFGEVCAE